MGKTITIEPLTRIEGHAEISLRLDDQGVVEDAKLHVTQFRGFEKFCEGRPFYEMPSLMARTCGICPVSHLIAGAKACDDLLAVRIPPAAVALRRVLNLAQLMQSHALSFFYLSAPDVVLGMDGDPAKRNLFGILETRPELARDGIRLRQIGQQIIETLSGKRIHGAWVVPGGVNEPLTEERRERIAGLVPEALAVGTRTLKWFRTTFNQLQAEIATFGNFPSLFLGLVNERGQLAHYDGGLRVVDSAGNVLVSRHDTVKYEELIAEAVEPWTYMKMPFYKAMGYPAGMYRVGPLARLNVVESCGTPVADEALEEFRGATPVVTSFHYHWARLIEIIYAAERIGELLDDPDILSTHVRARAEPNSFDGVGVSEAPRGTLIHHYRIDREGLITWANLIIATGHNNLAMSRAILQVARNFVDGKDIKEGMLNRVEAVIRAFDPCLSCATHAAGQMPLRVRLYSRQGELLSELARPNPS